MAQQAFEAWMQARLADAQTAQAYAAALWQQRSLVAPSDTQLAALTHTLLLVVAVNVSVALLVPRSRKLVLDAVETVLAVALLVVLLATVLGLPLVIIYLVVRATSFLLNMLLALPAVAALVASLRSTVGL